MGLPEQRQRLVCSNAFTKASLVLFALATSLAGCGVKNLPSLRLNFGQANDRGHDIPQSPIVTENSPEGSQDLAVDLGNGLCAYVGVPQNIKAVVAQGRSLRWVVSNGPGTCSFDPPDAGETQITCDRAGAYTISLSVADQEQNELKDSLELRVHPRASGGVDGCFEKVMTPVGAAEDIPVAVAVQPDGKVIILGSVAVGANIDFALVRYNRDGSLDRAFGQEGKVTTDVSGRDVPQGIALQPDGKIVVVGTSDSSTFTDMTVLRYNVNGALDTTFNATGRLQIPVGADFDQGNAVVVQKDGKIIVGGLASSGTNYDFAVVRLNADGALDSTFGTNGRVLVDFLGAEDGVLALALQADGKIVAAGYSYAPGTDNNDYAIARLNPNGSLDATFSGDGKDRIAIGLGRESCYSVAVLSDNKILCAGLYVEGTGIRQAGILRYDASGNLDTSFGGGDGVANVNLAVAGTEIYDFVKVLPDGGVVAAGFHENGQSQEFALARINAAGALDNSFGTNGRTFFDLSAERDGARAVGWDEAGNFVLAGSVKNVPDFGWVRVFK